MLIPKFWAEASKKLINSDGRQATLRRYGWSMTDQADAQKVANERLEEAAIQWQSNRKLRRRERRIAYGGQEGLPIREEVIDVQDTYTITRNCYGALCLNTPNVLIVDVDFSEDQSLKSCLALAGLGLVGLILSAKQLWVAAAIFGALFVIGLFVWNNLQRRLSRSDRQKKLSAIERFSQSNPDWGIRVYQTPLGFRIIVTHRLFDPTSDEVQSLFKTLNTDRVYARMCLQQNCFRARLTAKPWRCGVETRISSRTWPVSAEVAVFRNKWIEQYNAQAIKYAACKFLWAKSGSTIAPEAKEVVDIHDRLTQCELDLPLA
ncbi:MAG: hypothetical protein U0930_23140 [Pirellulales bacterium]